MWTKVQGGDKAGFREAIRSYFEGFPNLPCKQMNGLQGKVGARSNHPHVQHSCALPHSGFPSKQSQKSRNRRIGQWWRRGKRFDLSMISSTNNSTYLSLLLQTRVQYLRSASDSWQRNTPTDFWTRPVVGLPSTIYTHTHTHTHNPTHYLDYFYYQLQCWYNTWFPLLSQLT